MCGKQCLIYDIDIYGGIVDKKFHEPTNNLDKYSSKNIAKEILEVYYETIE